MSGIKNMIVSNVGPALGRGAESVGTPFINLREAAVILDVSRDTLTKLRKQGYIGPKEVMIGPQRVKWFRDEFNAWVKAGCPSAVEWRKSKDGAANA